MVVSGTRYVHEVLLAVEQAAPLADLLAGQPGVQAEGSSAQRLSLQCPLMTLPQPLSHTHWLVPVHAEPWTGSSMGHTETGGGGHSANATIQVDEAQMA